MGVSASRFHRTTYTFRASFSLDYGHIELIVGVVFSVLSYTVIGPPREGGGGTPLYKPYGCVRIKLTAKTVDEDPASFKRWISRKMIKSAKI